MIEEEKPKVIGQKASWFYRLVRVFFRKPRDREQLIAFLQSTRENGLLDAEALRMIEGVLKVSEMQVRDIMIPRIKMVVVTTDQTVDEFLPIITHSGHSRFPVINNTKDEVVGILHAKDLLTHTTNDPFDIRALARPAMFIPESKHLNVLLREFRKNRNHMAIVADEYGGVAGFVTIEDVLEQIVGDIADEFDIEEEPNIKSLRPQQFTVKAETPIGDFNDYFNAQLSDEEFDTVGGFIMQKLGHMPKKGETLSFPPFEFTIVRADNRRIHLLRLIVSK